MSTDRLREATRLLKAGKTSEAFIVLSDFLKANPQNADGWYLMAHVTNKPEKKIEALERALRFNPDHMHAREALSRLRAHYQAEPFPQATPTFAAADPTQVSPRPRSIFPVVTGILGAVVATLAIGIIYLSTKGSTQTVVAPTVAGAMLTGSSSITDTLVPTLGTITEEAKTATPEIALVSSSTPKNEPPTVRLPTLPPSWTPKVANPTVTAHTTGGAPTQSGPGKWQYLERGSSIGPAASGLVLPAESKAGTTTPDLFLRCRENVFEIYIFAGVLVAQNYRAHQTTVRVKFDKGSYQTFEPQVSVKGDAFFFDSAQTFLQQLLAHNTMAVQFTLAQSGSVGTTFDLRGLRQRLPTLSCVTR